MVFLVGYVVMPEHVHLLISDRVAELLPSRFKF